MKAVLFGILFVFTVTVLAEIKKQTNVPPSQPIVTTWSKIKEMFE
jgi:hypothetical protein